MWEFLEKQESNPEALAAAVHALIGLAKSKDFYGPRNGLLNNLEMIKFTIICEASALVLSEDWQAFMEHRQEAKRSGGLEITGQVESK